MTSLTLVSPYPIYFFDQPAPPRSKKGKVANVPKPKEEKKEKRSENGKPLKLVKKAKSDDLPETWAREDTCEDDSAEDENEDPLASQKRAAPRLLNELGRLLYRNRGASLQLGDILNYSADAALKQPKEAKDAARRQAARRKKSQKKPSKTNQDATGVAAVAGEVSAVSPTSAEDMISGSGQDPDWLALPLQALDEATPPARSLCQWVVERLKASASSHVKPRVMDQVPSSPILRHYVDAKSGIKTHSLLSVPSEAEEVTPWRPPPLKKLHCRVANGSSFIYYPSGNMAVCHSHSGLPSGGFCTNVFTDSHEAPVILATVTASGHGSASHPVSSAVTALWDQHGGFLCDREGNLKKEWCWKTDQDQEKIVVKLAKGISLRLLSGTTALLCFKCDDNKVQLPLSLAPSSAKEAEADQTFPEESAGTLSARWKKGCHAVGELSKLRKKVRDILNAWLDYYRTATGLKRGEKKPKVAKGKHKKRALLAKKTLERAKAREKVPEKLEQPAKKTPREAPAKTRVPAKNTKEHSMLQIGPLRILGNIKQELVVVPDYSASRLCSLPHFPARSDLPPSVPLTVCPPLLRAALLQRPKGRSPKRCRCSTALMPVLQDAEYDAFITGQPRHSQQILVVAVTLPVKPGATPEPDALQQLYRRSNRKRTMPCAQMYIRGRLMFLGYVSSGRTCSASDLRKQILRTREDYRLGVSLPPDYKFSESAKVSAGCSEASNANKVEESAPTLTNDIAPEKEYVAETTSTVRASGRRVSG
ncbi:uncharacterized protein C3orf20-like isoform X2 [Hippocampus zosterae]|uniref:uncharacterized protein C3orf20-like isoform X2 n=1 Tax=Hippocampus zosterae TaxID=109293 RepID=UPI00223CABBA|nr:uncharacterized protein C3orf20-like isoform X2 [Hippocampus zosterae]